MAALPRHGRDGVTDDSGRCEAAKPEASNGSNPPVPVGEAAATNLKTVQALVDALEWASSGQHTAIAAGRALIEQMKREHEAQPAVVDPTDPGHDVEVLRNHVRVLERRVRDLHRERNEAPAAKAVRMLTSEEIDALVRDSAITEDSIRAIIKRAAYKVLEVNGLSLSGAAGVQREAERERLRAAINKRDERVEAVRLWFAEWEQIVPPDARAAFTEAMPWAVAHGVNETSAEAQPKE